MKGRILAQPLVLATVTLAAGCSEDKWEGYVHPDRMDREVYDYVGTYASLEACREMALMRLGFTRAPHRADYECGKNCRWELIPGGIIKRCEATSR